MPNIEQLDCIRNGWIANGVGSGSLSLGELPPIDGLLMDISSNIRPIKARLKAAVTARWRIQFGHFVLSADWDVDFYDSGDALAVALQTDFDVLDLVILDLALASPALAARLGMDGPRVLAFGDPANAGVALKANLADFIAEAPSAADLRGAIEEAIAMASFGEGVPVGDLSDRTMARLGSLGAEATRIADALARIDVAATAPPPPIDLARLRTVIRLRRARDRFFPADLFGEPAWDMLLDLAMATVERRDVAVSSLCIAAAVPTTTALRWIKTLCDTGLFERRDDPHDARRAFISLSTTAEQAMARYLAQTT